MISGVFKIIQPNFIKKPHFNGLTCVKKKKQGIITKNNEPRKMQSLVFTNHPFFKLRGSVFTDINPFGRFYIEGNQKAVVEPDGNILYAATRNNKLFIGTDKICRI